MGGGALCVCVALVVLSPITTRTVLAQKGGGACVDNADCGYNGAIVGGACVDGKCECYRDFTCAHCQAEERGDGTCEQSAGGGSCASVADCSNRGSCSNALCVCFDSASCPHCEQNGAYCTRDPDRDGTYPCEFDIECGIASANAVSLRLDAVGLGGTCGPDGVCSCVEGYGCAKCNVQLDVYGSAVRALLPPANGTLDMCAVEWGGGRCIEDAQCTHGLCLNGGCVCYYGWACPYCTHDANAELRRGVACTDLQTGFAECTEGFGCYPGQGICVDGHCVCDTPYTCQDCSVALEDILTGNRTCPCNTVDCGDHGHCEGGVCSCDEGWTGIDCTIEACSHCFGHGTCNAVGKCDCDEGFVGIDCGKGGAACSGNGTCGFNGEVAGGACVNGRCVCYDGFTCPSCESVGEICSQATGGGKCARSSECGIGQCRAGICVCDPGYTCQYCNEFGSLCHQPYAWTPPEPGQDDDDDGNDGDSGPSGVVSHPAVVMALMLAGAGACIVALRMRRRCVEAEDQRRREQRAANGKGVVDVVVAGVDPHPGPGSVTAHLHQHHHHNHHHHHQGTGRPAKALHGVGFGSRVDVNRPMRPTPLRPSSQQPPQPDHAAPQGLRSQAFVRSSHQPPPAAVVYRPPQAASQL